MKQKCLWIWLVLAQLSALVPTAAAETSVPPKDRILILISLDAFPLAPQNDAFARTRPEAV